MMSTMNLNKNGANNQACLIKVTLGGWSHIFTIQDKKSASQWVLDCGKKLFSPMSDVLENSAC